MKEGLTRQIRFRVDAGSYEKLRRDAGRQGLSVSDYLRSLVMDPPDVGRVAAGAGGMAGMRRGRGGPAPDLRQGGFRARGD